MYWLLHALSSIICTQRRYLSRVTANLLRRSLAAAREHFIGNWQCIRGNASLSHIEIYGYYILAEALTRVYVYAMDRDNWEIVGLVMHEIRISKSKFHPWTRSTLVNAQKLSMTSLLLIINMECSKDVNWTLHCFDMVMAILFLWWIY